eukprot:gene39005-51300_t
MSKHSSRERPDVIAAQKVLAEVWPGGARKSSVELLKALHVLTRDGGLNLDSRRKLKQVLHLVQLLRPSLDALLADKAKLTAVLTYHVVPGTVMAKDVKAGKVKTVQGSELTVTTAGGVMVDKAKVVKTDIVADNGVIHVIDSVVLPPM